VALHRLSSITVGVPDVGTVAGYYREFGLLQTAPGRLATRDGGEQLILAASPRRRLIELGIGIDDQDDIARIALSLRRLDVPHSVGESRLTCADAGTQVRIVAHVAPRIDAESSDLPVTNYPGLAARQQQRAAGVLRTAPVRPRKLGHVVLGTTDYEASRKLFIAGLGFKISDDVPGLAAFLRCSTDHHNVLIQAAPTPLLHHTSWQVDDVDDVGRGASTMLAADPSRHVWGLGRHHIGSNFFWYLRDPAGNFSEYYSDLDCIVDDALWKPGVFTDSRALWAWGPPPPPSFLAPDDLADLMTSAHA